jgi:hypothetical protein
MIESQGEFIDFIDSHGLWLTTQAGNPATLSASIFPVRHLLPCPPTVAHAQAPAPVSGLSHTASLLHLLSELPMTKNFGISLNFHPLQEGKLHLSGDLPLGGRTFR